MSENLKELAYETIKQKIIYCEYRPNTFLSESLLMKEIDASRTPIREALNKLEQECISGSATRRRPGNM